MVDSNAENSAEPSASGVESQGVSSSAVVASNANESAPVSVKAAGSEALVDDMRHPVFLLAYAANLALVTANAATFVFADWVAWLATNGTTGAEYQEELPGRIVQYGILAAITARVFLGQSIDRFGVRRVWLVMSFLALCGVAIFSSLSTVSWLLPFGRILFATGLAGMFTCGTFHIQSCVVEHRRTEFIALLGSSGFVGMILGPQMAELLRWLSSDLSGVFFPRLFAMATVLLVAHIGCVLFITKGIVRPEKHEMRPSLISLTRTYWPGMVMGVSMTMGVVFTVLSLYLARFNHHENLGGIATYWTMYALSAFFVRVKTASLSQKIGRHRLILIGLITQGLGVWMLIPVTAWWHLVFSGLTCGFGHALLFPSIVSLGSGTFPARYRGSGTNLTLGCLDFGSGASAPLLGRIIDMELFGGAGFRQMFFIAGMLPLVMALTWYLLHGRSSDSEIQTN